MPVDRAFNQITWKIIAGAIAVHRALGPGLLESAYARCLEAELGAADLRVDVRVRVPVVYRGVSLDCGYWLDLLVENAVIVEIKAILAIAPIHEAQLLTYLKLTGKPVGLLINFNVPILKDGIVRKINIPRS